MDALNLTLSRNRIQSGAERSRLDILDQGTRDVFDGVDSRKARAVLPSHLHDKAAELLDRLNAASLPDDLRTPRGNRLNQLHGDRAGQWSISINGQYRICFAGKMGERWASKLSIIINEGSMW
jgi:proteic killer suppression protein